MVCPTTTLITILVHPLRVELLRFLDFLLFAFLTLIIMAVGLRAVLTSNNPIEPLFIQSIVLFIGLFTLMIITGVSGKYRNNVALSIPFYFIISYLIVHIKNINIKRAYLFSVLVLSAISISNLITHRDTAKNSYNMPVAELATILQNPSNKLIITYDPVTYFHLTDQGYNVQYLLQNNPQITIAKGTSIYTVKTYQGSVDDQDYQKVLLLYGKFENCMKTVHKEEIGIDKYYELKNKLPGNRPKIDQVQMYITHGELKDKCSHYTWSK